VLCKHRSISKSSTHNNLQVVACTLLENNPSTPASFSVTGDTHKHYIKMSNGLRRKETEKPQKTSEYETQLVVPAKTPPEKISDVADSIREHISNNSPPDPGLKARLDGKGWVLGRTAAQSGTWTCNSCKEARPLGEVVCVAKPTCKGVSAKGFFQYLFDTGYSLDYAPTEESWGDVLKIVSGVKQDINISYEGAQSSGE